MPRTSEPAPLLLDTHIWLWQVLATGGLMPHTRAMINEAVGAGRLLLAAISIWEVAMLASRNRIAVEKPTSIWFVEALGRSHVNLEPLSPEIAVESCQLPGGFRSDPADELIVATARVTGATLLTRDRAILDYAALGHLQALPA